MPRGNVRVSITADADPLNREVRGAERTLDRFGKGAGKSMKHVGGAADVLGGKFGKLAKAASAVGAAYLVIAEGKEAINVTTDLAKATLSLNKSFGLSVKTASEFAAVAKARGAETKPLIMGFKSLATAVRNAGVTGGAAALPFKELGISQKELARSSGDLDKIIRMVSKGLGDMPAGANKAAISAKLFGRTWVSLAPIIRSGTKDMDEQLQMADRYGATFSKMGLKDMEDFIKAQREAKIAMLGLQVTIGTKLAPILTDVILKVSTFVQQMRSGKGAGGRFAETMVRFGKVLEMTFKAMHELGVSFRHFGRWLAEAGKNVAEFGKGVVKWLVNVWGNVKRSFGDAMAAIFRGFAKLFDLASKLPGQVGDQFDDLQTAAEHAAKKVDKLGEEIKGLHSKKVKVDVQVALGPGGKEFRPNDGWGVKDAVAAKVQNAFDSGDLMAPLGAFGGGGSANLMGANANLAPFAALGTRFGLSVTSGYRPGSITSSGNLSYHAMRRAIDVNAGSAAGMLAYARAMASRFGGRLKELIHTPLGFSIKNGQRVAPYATAEHYDHVHVAMAKGGRTQQKVRALVGEEGPEIVDLPVGAFVHTASKTKQMMGGAIAAFQGGGEVLPKSVYAAINRAMTPEFNTWSQHRYHMTGKRLLAKVAAVEGGGSIDEGTSNTSSAGARGPFQFIKSTRDAYLAKYHIDAWKNDYSAARAAMIHLRGTGIAGYNPGLAAYEGMVLGAGVNTRPLRTGQISDQGLSRRERRERTPTHGETTTGGILETRQDARHERVWGSLSGIRDDEKITPREGQRAIRAYSNRSGVLQQRIAAKKRRLRKVNNALKGELRPATRQRLLREKETLISDLIALGVSQRELRSEFKELMAPFETEPEGPFVQQEMHAALAALTPGTEDDVAAAKERLWISAIGLEMAKQGGDAVSITDWATQLKSAQDALESLTGELAAAAAMQQQLIDLQKEANQIEKQKVSLAKSQGPALLLALAGISNGWIGGNAGLGRSFPSFAGLGGLARV